LVLFDLSKLQNEIHMAKLNYNIDLFKNTMRYDSESPTGLILAIEKEGRGQSRDGRD
jgi:hypothetical protein